MAESFVDSYKTELIADRVWRSRSELKLATVEWVAWFNTVRLHSSLGDIPPAEHEQHAAAVIAQPEALSAVGPLPDHDALARGDITETFGLVDRRAIHNDRFHLKPPV